MSYASADDVSSTADPMPSSSDEAQANSTQSQADTPPTVASLTSALDTATATISVAQSTLVDTVSSATTYQLEKNIDSLKTAQSNINDATASIAAATSAVSDMSAAQSVVDSATATAAVAQVTLTNATTAVSTQEAVVSSAQDAVTSATASVSTNTDAVTTSVQAVESATSVKVSAESALSNASQQVVAATTAKAAADAVVAANTTPGLKETIYYNPGTGASPAMGGTVKLVTTDTNGINEQWGSSGPSVPGGTVTTVETFTGNKLNTDIGITVNGTPVSTTNNNNVYIASIGWPSGVNGSDPSLTLRTPTATTTITMPANTTSAGFSVFAKNGNTTGVVTYTDGTTETYVLQDDVNPNYPNYVHQETFVAPEGKTIATVTIPADWDYFAIDNVSATKTTSTVVTDDFQVKWEGLWTPQTTGTQYIYAPADDGVKLYLDGQLVINDWVDKGGGGSTADVQTTAGIAKVFEMWYYENGGGANVALMRYTGSGWEVIPASEFSQSTATASQRATAAAATTALNNANTTRSSAQQELNTATASLSTAQQNLTNAQSALAAATAALSAAQQNLTTQTATLETLEQAKIDAQTAVDAAQADLQAATDTLAVKTTVASLLVQVAQSLTNTADASVSSAVVAVSNTPTQAPQPAPVWTPEPPVVSPPTVTPEPPTPVEPPSQEETTTPPSTPDSESESSSDAPTDATDTSTDASSTDSSSTDSSSSDTSQPSDTTQTPTDTGDQPSTPQDGGSTDSSQTPTPDPAPKETQPSTPPTSPDSLPETTPLLPPASALVPRVQVDQAGVTNGGIQFYGTKSQPQVVGEDGKLTPPPPPPGSGLPIPPDAITTSDTFIGQPGGTTFNAPDIAVPVEVTYVCHTITKSDGTEVHIDVDGNEHPIEQCQFLPAALDAIPGAGQAIQAMGAAYAALANIGNDMSPITRKKAKKILVITTVVAAVRRRFGN